MGKEDQRAVLGKANELTAATRRFVAVSREGAGPATEEAEEAVHEAARTLRQALEASSAQLTVHERAIEVQKSAIGALLVDAPRDSSATGEDAVRAAKEIIQASADMYFAESSDQAVEAAQKSFVAAQGLAAAVNKLKESAPDAATREAVEGALERVLKAAVATLDQGKRNREDESVKLALEQASEQMRSTTGDLVYALRRLPGQSGLTLDDKAANDLDTLAEQELLKCAQIIADAAKTLMQAKPRRKVAGGINQEDINDAILDGATAIARATQALIEAAAIAQGERVKLKGTPAGKRYQADPTWANGLISAAQGVAGSVTTLVKAANESVAGKAQEEALVANSRAVAQATAHLVAASRAKADPDSRAQLALKNAARSVTGATAQLVAAANAAAQFQQEEAPLPRVDFGTAGGKAKELEQQMTVLRLEKELDKARQVLNQMRKSRYTKKH